MGSDSYTPYSSGRVANLYPKIFSLPRIFVTWAKIIVNFPKILVKWKMLRLKLLNDFVFIRSVKPIFGSI